MYMPAISFDAEQDRRVSRAMLRKVGEEMMERGGVAYARGLLEGMGPVRRFLYEHDILVDHGNEYRIAKSIAKGRWDF